MSYFNKKIIGITIVVVCFLGLSTLVHAFTLSPIRLEISGDPGQIVVQQMTLINELTTTETYYSSYLNFQAEGETGTPTFVFAKDDLGTWMQVPESVTLAPGESKVVPVKITIPQNADPGGHFAAIFWATTPTNKAPGSVAIGAKTGMLVLLHVSGAVDEKGGILEFVTKDKQTFYTSLPISFFYRFQNNGGDRIKPDGDIAFKNILGLTSDKIPANPVDGNILPNSIRKFETVWQSKDGPATSKERDQGNFLNKVGYEWNNFAFGHYTAELNLTYGTTKEVATAVFSFWVFPWHLIIFLIILLLLIFFIARVIIRHYNHWVILKAEEL
ncbi:MAG TPA: hypothetical protein VGO21_05335, partial [Candidatus Paceibacterota bacterium]|nr:hypothetical protein [Candidatus Paceibacterota bacterium]